MYFIASGTVQVAIEKGAVQLGEGDFFGQWLCCIGVPEQRRSRRSARPIFWCWTPMTSCAWLTRYLRSNVTLRPLQKSAKIQSHDRADVERKLSGPSNKRNGARRSVGGRERFGTVFKRLIGNVPFRGD